MNPQIPMQALVVEFRIKTTHIDAFARAVDGCAFVLAAGHGVSHGPGPHGRDHDGQLGHCPYTPPVGGTLFVAAKLANATIGEITRHLWLMMAATFSIVMLVTYVPELTLWLPRFIAGMG